MTSVDPSGAARPGRVAGLALLGVAAVALVIGLITVFGGNGSGQADGAGDAEQLTSEPPTSEPRPTTTSPSSTRPPSTTRPPSSTTRPPTSSTSAPTTRPPGGDNNGEPTKATPVRVYNNSTIKGLAARAADDLAAAGWPVAEVGNYSAGTIPTTTVYFRPGTGEEAPARELAADFGMRAESRFEGIADAQPGVIVIVTNDYQGLSGKNDK